MVIGGADDRAVYVALVAAVAVERLIELAISRRHARRLRARGGVEAGGEHYPMMVAVHTAFLAACPLEVYGFQRPLLPWLALPMLLLLVGSMALRYWVVATLGERWSTRVIVLPGAAPVERGPFRYLRHPNYLAVIVEMAALPLIHSAWITAIVFSAANAAILRTRIATEDAALGRAAGGLP